MDFETDLTLGKLLGEGATAVTYEAQDADGNIYCVKRYKSSLKVKDLQKVEREIQLLEKIDHPQIPHVYGFFIKEIDGRKLLHVVQEKIDGQDLSAILEEEDFGLSRIYDVLEDCLKVLVYLHSVTPPVIHRDVKLSNLMLRSDNRIVLIDFGHAVGDIQRTYGQTMVTGTLGYQAPEQIIGEAKPKSDVYSLGVSAVELLTQKKPYTMLEKQQINWKKHCSHLSFPLQTWLEGVLQEEVSQRWTAKKALEELQKIQAGEYLPIQKNPPKDSKVSEVGHLFDSFLNLFRTILSQKVGWLIFIVPVILFPICLQNNEQAKQERAARQELIEQKLPIISKSVPIVEISNKHLWMGCERKYDDYCNADEKPRYSVNIRQKFYVMEGEVTQKLYQEIMGKNPSHFKGENHPVENVSWYDAAQFANQLSEKHGLQPCYSISGNDVRWDDIECKGWRLPTETEWELASKGGRSFKYAGADSIDEVAWVGGDSHQEICQKKRNGFALCDMSGNVSEWVWDWYDSESYQVEKKKHPRVLNPIGAETGEMKVNRGGSWLSGEKNARTTARTSQAPLTTAQDLGFRLVWVP